MKLLWLKSELLHPVDKGGKIRSYQMLKHLKRKHEVTYLSLTTESDPPESFTAAAEYCDRLVTIPWRESRKFSPAFYRDLVLNVASPLPYAIQKYRSAEMRRAIETELHQSAYDYVVSDFLVPSINLPDSVNVPTVLFQHNVEAMIWQRHYETTTDSVKRRYFHNQWRKMRRYEEAMCRRFDAVVAVSAADRDTMRAEYNLTEVYDVPTGVDTDFFQPGTIDRDPFELVFTGSMDWLPNEDAIIYFAEQILPRVVAALPRVHLTVVGRQPSKRLAELARVNPQITITGRVDDIRPYVHRASGYVVPMRIGGGTRIKIYEAMAMECPVISTTIGAEGLPVQNGEDLLIADTPVAFAESIIHVLTDKPLARKIGHQSRRVVCERFGWDRASSVFAAICEQVARSHGRKRAA